MGRPEEAYACDWCRKEELRRLSVYLNTEHVCRDCYSEYQVRVNRVAHKIRERMKGEKQQNAKA